MKNTFLTIKQFAGKHNVSTQAIYLAIKSGRIKPTVIGSISLIQEDQDYNARRKIKPPENQTIEK